MTETQQAPQPDHSAHAPAKPGEKQPVKIHRVCIGCNQMFEVTLDHYEAKHCPVCHKA
jgi:rRNA maturation endonuclease Nob1